MRKSDFGRFDEKKVVAHWVWSQILFKATHRRSQAYAQQALQCAAQRLKVGQLVPWSLDVAKNWGLRTRSLVVARSWLQVLNMWYSELHGSRDLDGCLGEHELPRAQNVWVLLRSWYLGTRSHHVHFGGRKTTIRNTSRWRHIQEN